MESEHGGAPDERREAGEVKVDRTISHGAEDELRTTIGEQLEARRGAAERKPPATAPARDESGPTRSIGNTDQPVHSGDSDGGGDAA